MTSILTKNQVKVCGPRKIEGYGANTYIKAEVRHDDRCGNGHNAFSITGEIYVPGRRDCEACGCLHNEIAKSFPELAPFIKWHLCSTDGPMHYLANTLYHAGDRDLDAARSCAIWPEATDEDLLAPDLKAKLENRLPALMAEFRAAVESLGLVY